MSDAFLDFSDRGWTQLPADFLAIDGVREAAELDLSHNRLVDCAVDLFKLDGLVS